MSVLTRSAFCAAAVLALSACDPRYVHPSDLSVQEIGRLSGTWSGRAPLSFSNNKACPKAFMLTLTVKDGTVNGTVVNAAFPNVEPAIFSTFVEYDGSMHGAVRTKGYDLALLGSFNHDGYRGTARAQDCGYVMTLRHEGPGS